jgi:hypothetical protein
MPENINIAKGMANAISKIKDRQKVTKYLPYLF